MLVLLLLAISLSALQIWRIASKQGAPTQLLGCTRSSIAQACERHSRCFSELETAQFDTAQIDAGHWRQGLGRVGSSREIVQSKVDWRLGARSVFASRPLPSARLWQASNDHCQPRYFLGEAMKLSVTPWRGWLVSVGLRDAAALMQLGSAVANIRGDRLNWSTRYAYDERLNTWYKLSWSSVILGCS